MAKWQPEEVMQSEYAFFCGQLPAWKNSRQNQLLEAVARRAEIEKKPRVSLIGTTSEYTAQDFLRRLCEAARKYPKRVKERRLISLRRYAWNSDSESGVLPEGMENLRVVSHLSEIPYFVFLGTPYIVEAEKGFVKVIDSRDAFKSLGEKPDFLDLLTYVFRKTGKQGGDFSKECFTAFLEADNDNLPDPACTVCGFDLRRKSLEILDAAQARERMADIILKMEDRDTGIQEVVLEDYV